MARPMALTPLGRTMQLPLTLAGGFRTTFAELASSPLPSRLVALMARLEADRTERSGESANGAIPTETWNRINRRGGR
jgi:hypothetical protein